MDAPATAEEPPKVSPAAAADSSADQKVEETPAPQPVPSTEDAAPASTAGDSAPAEEAKPADNGTAAAEGSDAAAAAAPEEVKVEVVPRDVIVTGASSGIGLEVAKVLCEAGHDVTLACRNEEKANRAIEKIRKQNPNAKATFMQLDLSSMESVRSFVESYRATGKKLSVLVNNAGVLLNFKDTKRQYTKDKFELTMGTNHLGHFLLTNLLLSDLKQTASDGGDARVVVVSSGLHDIEMAKKRGPVQPFDLENPFLLNDGTYSGLQAYKNSKLANVMFTYELSRQLEGSGVKVNAVDPGFVPTTELSRYATAGQKFFTRYVLHGMLRFTKMTRTVGQAGGVICAMATGDKFKETTGKYIRDGAEVKSSEESLDEEKQKKLWELSGGYTRLDGFEPLDAPEPPPEPVKEEPAKQEQKPADAAAATVNGDATEQDNKTKDETIETTAEGTKDKDPAEVNNAEEKKDAEKKNAEEKKEEPVENSKN